jgi:hypothetical protein
MLPRAGIEQHNVAHRCMTETNGVKAFLSKTRRRLGRRLVTRSILVLQRFHGLGCGQACGTKKEPRGVPIMGDPKVNSL